MARPGYEIINRDAAPPRGAPTDTGGWFVAGLTERGPADRPVRVSGMRQYEAAFGERVGYGTLYDPLELFFREGGTVAHVARAVGPGATASFVVLNDALAAPSLTVTATGPGVYGDDLGVAVIASGGGYALQVYYEGALVEASPELTTAQDAEDWALGSSSWVTIAATGTEPPAVIAEQGLSGGDDDRANITNAEWGAALELFPSELGPGQVSIPGAGSTVRDIAVAHALANNRAAVIDATDSASAASVIADAGTLLDATEGSRRAILVGPPVTIPGIITGTVRSVPASGFVAGLIARNDARLSPNRAAAGNNGIARYALAPTRTYTAAEYEALNDAHVSAVRVINEQTQLYGFRSLATGLWSQFTGARLRMAIEARAAAIAQQYVFEQIDGFGHLLSRFEGQLRSMLLELYAAGSLYGATPEEAFAVDVGPVVNPVEDLADGIIRAVLSVRMSPFGELVIIEIVRTPITEPIA